MSLKKSLALITIILALFLLSACSKQPLTDTGATEAQSQESNSTKYLKKTNKMVVG